MDNIVLSKDILINFFNFLKKKNETIIKNNKLDENNTYKKDILSYYNEKTKLLFIPSNELNKLINKYSKANLIKYLSILFRNNEIEYPYVKNIFNDLSINDSIIKKIINTFNDPKKYVIKQDIVNKLKEYTIKTELDLTNIFDEKYLKKHKDFDIEFYKKNINYLIINYFAEKDILKCKRKKIFVSPYNLIYSDNKYVDTLFTFIIDTYQEVSSQYIKKYIKTNIAFCTNNVLTDLIAIIKHLTVLYNIDNLNIINIGIDWGEWIILGYLFPTCTFYSYYLNNLSKNTIDNLNNVFTISNLKIQQQITSVDEINNNNNNKDNKKIIDNVLLNIYDIIYINLDFILSINTSDINILDKIFKVKFKYIIIKTNNINDINQTYIKKFSNVYSIKTETNSYSYLFCCK
jgi:hypothetical protein